MDKNNQTIVFYESQRLTQWYLYLPLIIIQLILIYISVQNDDISFTDILVPSAIPIGLVLLFLSYKMETTISQEVIIVKTSWFGGRKISLKSIERFIWGQYSFLGYGVRITTFGKAYNVNGNKGMLIVVRNKKILIGSQKYDELMVAMRTLVSDSMIVVLEDNKTIQDYIKETN